MALTAAEKQKRYREKLKKNLDKYEEAKKKHREHYHKTKRLVKDLTPKERRNANVIWKLRQQAYRKKLKTLQNVLAVTPPSSPASSIRNFLEDNHHTPPASPASDSAIVRGRKKIRKDRSKVYRENENLKIEIENLKKKVEKYKKRANRVSKTSSIDSKDENEAKKPHQKYNILANSIKKRYKEMKERKGKKILKTVEVEESRQKTELIKDVLGINREYIIKHPSSSNSTMLKERIHGFFLRDDISRATAGKKDTVTKNGEKVQKRYLLETQLNLYKIFKAENPNLPCSYFYFTKNRPFYVVRPSVDAREMCLCKTHSNFSYKAEALKKQKVIEDDNLSTLVRETVCDDLSKDCMYSVCEECKNKKVKYNEQNITGTIEYSEWIRKEVEYEKEGKKYKSIKKLKELKKDQTEHFVQNFEKDMKHFKKHIYNIKTQFHNFHQCWNDLQENECLVVVDFSENYNCKYFEEIQAHHFNSRNQISLHTVMVYTYDAEKKYKAHSFCTISSSNCHQPAAIWAHLEPIMEWIRKEYESVDTVHFFSDGPSTQYRQKQNFYLLCTRFFDFGFSATSWSFFEAGHGKGPADGIGGFLKRTADSIVASGRDIADAVQFYDIMKTISKINLYLIENHKIEQLQNELPKFIPRLVGTMKVHQIFTDKRAVLKHRILSCFCKSAKRGFCNCFNPQVYSLVGSEPVDDKNSSDDDLPLSTISVLQEIQNIPRQSIYKAVYGSSSDGEDTVLDLASTSNKENAMQAIVDDYTDYREPEPSTSFINDPKQVDVGDFLHVNVYTSAIKKKMYSYVCKALTAIEEDGEVKVMFLRVVSKDAKRFRLDETDVSYIDSEDIIKILPNPAIVKKGHRVYYEFKTAVDIFEK